MTQLMTRDRMVLGAVLPTNKHHKLKARNGQCRNGHSTNGNNGSAVVQQVTCDVEVLAIWEPHCGGEAVLCLSALIAALSDTTKNPNQPLTRAIALLKSLHEELRSRVVRALGDDLRRRVGELRIKATSLAARDRMGSLLITAGDVTSLRDEVEALIRDVGTALARHEESLRCQEKESGVDELVQAMRDQRAFISARKRKLSYVRHKRVERRRRRQSGIRHARLVWETLARAQTKAFTVQPQAKEEDDDPDTLADWEAFAREQEEADPWAEYAEGDGNGGEVNGSGRLVVGLVIVGVAQTACGRPCNGCPLATNCPNSTTIQTDQAGGDGSSDVDDLFRPDGKWREDGVGD